MQVIHPRHDAGSPEHVGGEWLLIRRGRTRFPRRPLNCERVLIGAGTNCHLQLGGDVPMLHSLLSRTDGLWRVESIAPSPELFVNDVPSRCHELKKGDVMRIAEFEFVLCGDEGGERLDELADDQHGQAAVCVSACREAARGLSPNELVDRIAAQIDLIDRIQGEQSAAASRLLRAIKRQTAKGRSGRRAA